MLISFALIVLLYNRFAFSYLTYFKLLVRSPKFTLMLAFVLIDMRYENMKLYELIYIYIYILVFLIYIKYVMFNIYLVLFDL